MISADPVILAIASPPGRSARCLVRASGTQTFDLLHSTLTLRDGSAITAATPRAAHPSRLRLRNQTFSTLAMVMHAPLSFTGEDTIELILPGNPTLAQRIMDDIIATAAQRSIPARRATAGEFSARAFMNGRMSLTQAEGVAASISAESDAELAAARLLQSGAVGDRMEQLANTLADALALVEAGIDFTDQDDVVAISPASLRERLESVLAAIRSHLNSAVPIEQLRASPWVVLVGKPNAGKSSLFNALIGKERAVVSELAGTTRDVLVEPITIPTQAGPAEVMLADLAGLDASDETINALMQQHAMEARQRADLIVRCVPIDEEIETESGSELLVRTKADMSTRTHADPKPTDSIRGFPISAHIGMGLTELRQTIATRLAHRTHAHAADVVALLPRHASALRIAADMLTAALNALRTNTSERHLEQPELLAADMRSALDELAAFVGNMTPDDVLARVFAKFCIGK